MKHFEGLEGIGMTERQARGFLTKSRTPLLLGTTNSDGTPVIHPVWYYFDPVKTKLYFYTGPTLRKANNIKERNQIYFDVDDGKWPYKGVKGRGRARLISSERESLSLCAKILARYVKGGPFVQSVLDRVKNGGYVIFEITPEYFTSWDFGKLDPESGRILRKSIIS